MNSPLRNGRGKLLWEGVPLSDEVILQGNSPRYNTLLRECLIDLPLERFFSGATSIGHLR